MRLTWPLTGRSEEMRSIEAAIAAPDSSGIVVWGAAGVGKSRTAREALSIATANGYESRWATGTSSGRGIPLSTFAPWVGPTADENPQLLEVVQGVINVLTSADPGTVVVVGVDDAHLLDDLSTFVLHQIVLRGAAKVVLTIRDGEPVPDGLREVWKDGQFDRLDLQPLSQNETTNLISAALDGPVEPDAATRLWRLTRGNVLYLRNIVEQEVADGRMVRRQGYWTWLGDPVVPPSLVELIETRLGTFPAPVSDVVDVLAVGEPMDLASLVRITDIAAVEDADNRGLIALEPVHDGIEVRVAHPLYGEVRRRRTARTRLRRLRALVATELGASDNRDDIRVIVRRATLTLDSDLEPDRDLFLTAAQAAVRLADLPLAERLANAAIRAGAGVEAKFLRAHVLSFLSRGEEAVAVLDACSPHELTEGDQARLAFLRSHITLFTCANPVAAKQMIDDAARTLPTHVRGCIDAFLALYWAVMGKPKMAIELSQKFDLDELPAVMGAGTAMAICVAHGDAGGVTEAIAAAHTGYAIAERSFDAAQMRFIITDGHIGALLQSGEVAEAGKIADRLNREAADMPGPAQFFSSAQVGMTALAAGRLDKACEWLEPAVGALSGDTTGWGYRYQLPLTIALAMLGAADEAVTALEALERQRHPTWRYLGYEHALARGWVAAVQGVASEGIDVVLSAAETARADGQLAPEVMCLQTAAQFGDRSVVSRLGELAEIVEGPRVALAARFAAALRKGDGRELAAVSEDFERLGDLVAALDVAAHSAMAYRSGERNGSALTCLSRAHELAVRCGGADTPALRAAGEPVRFTGREREVVLLVGQGLSSRAIADRLMLSVRTVEGHIYRAMARTGAADRDELGRMLPRRETDR